MAFQCDNSVLGELESECSIAEQIDLTSDEDFSQFLLLSNEGTDTLATDATSYFNTEYPAEYNPSVSCDNLFTNYNITEDSPKKTVIQATNTTNNHCSAESVGLQSLQIQNILDNSSNNNNIYKVKSELQGPENSLVHDHLYYTICNETNTGWDTNASPSKLQTTYEIAHESPGSDSGFSEEAPNTSINKVAPSIPSLPTSTSSKLASLLQQPHVETVTKPIITSTCSTPTNTVKVVIPQTILDNARSLSKSERQETIPAKGQNVKYLIPVSLDSKKTAGIPVRTTCKVVKVAQQVSGNNIKTVPSCSVTTSKSVSPSPTPLFVVPMAPKPETLKVVHFKEPAQNFNITNQPKLIKVLKSQVTEMSADVSQRVSSVQNSTSALNEAKKSSTEALKKQTLELSSKVSAKERKMQNAVRNIFICPMCDQYFAVNRILVKSGSMYVQGKPRYCIDCCEQVQNSTP